MSGKPREIETRRESPKNSCCFRTFLLVGMRFMRQLIWVTTVKTKRTIRPPSRQFNCPIRWVYVTYRNAFINGQFMIRLARQRYQSSKQITTDTIAGRVKEDGENLPKMAISGPSGVIIVTSHAKRISLYLKAINYWLQMMPNCKECFVHTWRAAM